MNRNTWTTALVLLLLKNKTENHSSKIIITDWICIATIHSLTGAGKSQL